MTKLLSRTELHTIWRQAPRNSRQPGRVNVALAINPHPTAQTIVISCPGRGGSIEGYQNKHVKMATMLHKEGLAVVRMENLGHKGFPYEHTLVDDIKTVIRFALKAALNICGTERPNIFFRGFSAGASGGVVACRPFSQVTKMLLISLSTDVEPAVLIKSVSAYKGELYLLAGRNDSVACELSEQVLQAANKTKAKLELVKNCTHLFQGPKNSQIQGRAVLWAFLGKNLYHKE
jgi:alpha/beta superfamily hydrolase